MPAKAKVTKEMIIEAAFAVARETGAENINARTVSERLHCSTHYSQDNNPLHPQQEPFRKDYIAPHSPSCIISQRLKN